MSASFFFYDLETSGIRWQDCRVMQFAGQRTDMDLQPIGEPVNVLIKLTPDVLPDPQAILLTGITPQQTLAEGVTEFEFLQLFTHEVATRDTIFVGYNTVRFDDEFLRSMHFRNFYNPYAWHSWDDRSRWDLLDLTRMTRALRPDGIKWPISGDGKPTNRLELITALNGLDHENAHDALNDVQASIALAQLIHSRQPKLFDALLQLRGKNAVKKFLKENKTFVYTSGKYANECEKTAVVQLMHTGNDQAGAIVYDLRHDPAEFVRLSPAELVERWRYNKDADAPKRLPAKTLKFNRCPAICKVGIISDVSVQKRLGITPELVNKHRAILHENPEFVRNVVEAKRLMDAKRDAERVGVSVDVDEEVHEGFLGEADSILQRTVRAAAPEDLASYLDRFQDKRMRQLLPRYKARNFPEALTDEERAEWGSYLQKKLFDGDNQSLLVQYFAKLAECAADPKYADKQFLLEELQLYGQSLVPSEMQNA